MADKKLTFEEAYVRLEEILEQLSSEQVSLDDALAFYEEADELIGSCQKRLTEAEQKIEVLLKNRDGGLATGDDGTPAAETFTPPKHSALQE